jgi:hypothetical protein
MLDAESGQKFPALLMNLKKFLKEESADEIKTLLVRIDAGRTQLASEELNYSILKAHLSGETQVVIETTCKDLFRPSRFITIAYRLFQQTQKIDQ